MPDLLIGLQLRSGGGSGSGDAGRVIVCFSGADIAAPKGHITENRHASVHLNRLAGRRSGLRSLPLLRRDSD